MRTPGVRLLAVPLYLTAVLNASAQLYVATGTHTPVTADIAISIDPSANTLTVDIDNTHAGPGGMEGTITALGFADPFAADRTGPDGNPAGVSEHWLVLNAGHSAPTLAWQKFDAGTRTGGDGRPLQEFGVTSGSGSSGDSLCGVEFGEKAQFVFTFADLDVQKYAGYLGRDGLSVRWQAIAGASATLSDVGFVSLVPAPEPSAYALGGAALVIGAALLRRFRARRAGILPLDAREGAWSSETERRAAPDAA